MSRRAEAFRAWSLPTGAPVPGGSGSVRERAVREDGNGPRLAYPEPASVDVRGLRETLLTAREEALRPLPAEEVASILGSVGGRFATAGDPLREEALRLLPDHAGISAPMAREVLAGMSADWTEGRLRRLLRAEFTDPGVLDGFRPGPEGRVHASGPPLLVQVSAGNVPGVSVGSLLRSLLVKSALVLKPARSDAVLPVLFAQGLREAAPELAEAVAVVYWPGGGEEVEEAALEAADLVVAYGSMATVRNLRRRIAPTTRLVAYHHRVSFGAVSREALRRSHLPELARRAARSVALFDQRGCVSPHLIYAEEGGEVEPADLSRALAEALEDVAERLPPGPLEAAEATAAQQVRGTEEVREAAGAGVRVFGGAVGHGTVIHDPDPTFVPSCLARTIRVKPVPDLEAVGAHLAPVAPYLQSAALEAPSSRRERIAGVLARAGVIRVTDLDGLPWPPPWWHHDGDGPLRSLVTWRDLEGD